MTTLEPIKTELFRNLESLVNEIELSFEKLLCELNKFKHFFKGCKIKQNNNYYFLASGTKFIF